MDKEPSSPNIVTVGEAFDVMVEASGIVKTNASYLAKVTKPIIFIVAALVAIVVFLQIQLIFREDRIEKLENTVATLDGDVKSLRESSDTTRKAAQEAEIASEAAKTALDAAIAQSTGDTSTAEAIQRINELYEFCVERKEC